MFRSIRWDLLAWQAVILLAVVGGFGATLFLQVRYATFERVDADLLGAAQVVAAQLQETGSAQSVEIPAAYRQRFGLAAADAPYLVVWDAAGRVRIASGIDPGQFPPIPPLPVPESSAPFFSRSRGPFREVIVPAASQAQVLVGRQMGRERNELRRLLGWLWGAGLGIVALGLAWAWSLSRRLLAPVERMTGIAERISASNLSERIEAAGTKAELNRLAQVLNGMFERLQASFERQARFTADASHELRTPTAVVLAQSEWALAQPRSPEEYREALDACCRAAQRMQSLIEGLLTLARLDAGQLEIRRAPVDLRQLVESAIALLEPLAAQKQIELRADLRAVQVTGDAAGLAQVVANLLDNAVIYNREKGQIRLRLWAQEQQAILTVADTGIGIAQDDLVRIFERFYQVDQSRSGNRGGVGLGLALCQEIVRGHGGTLEVASVVGEGTTFTVRLLNASPLARG